ncbi:hypothetical protein KCP75_26270 (plasmid) [Salmonella enterica subsp. enterica]|nr:hypothetical protein KCP73_27275 [Salmonella enterica subsp. enterica]QUJ02650.1 hypothetical protein KCP75_26270 [Salmonella enterica subsp. enterica]
MNAVSPKPIAIHFRYIAACGELKAILTHFSGLSRENISFAIVCVRIAFSAFVWRCA